MPFGRATDNHKIDGTNTQCKFHPMQCPSVERTYCNRLYGYGRGRRRCGDPTNQAVMLPLVVNAHRAFRGEKHGRLPFGRATGKHKIDGINTQCKFQPMQCPSVERTFRNLLYIYGRGRRRCGDPTIQAVRLISFLQTAVAADCFYFVRRFYRL